MELVTFPGVSCLEFGLEHLGKKVVVTVVVTFVAERHDEQLLVSDERQELAGVVPPRDEPAEAGCELAEHRALQQEGLDLDGLPVEDFGSQVGGDLAAISADP